MRYERLMMEYQHLTIRETRSLPRGLSGLYYDNEILLNKNRNHYERHGILAEEIGHYETTHGDIIELDNVQNIKLELLARRWGYEKIVSLEDLIKCFELGYRTLDDICIYLEVTAEYLKNALDHYNARYGLYTLYKGYKITFDPLNIQEIP